MSSNRTKMPNAQTTATNGNQPQNSKYEIAAEKGIPLKQGDNGDLTAKQAGKIGGQIGGQKVKEMVRMAEQQMKNQ